MTALKRKISWDDEVDVVKDFKVAGWEGEMNSFLAGLNRGKVDAPANLSGS